MAITTREKADRVADLIKQGKLTGEARDRAMADLRAFHEAQQQTDVADEAEAEKPQAGRDYEDLSGENALARGAMGFARPIVETVYGAKQLVGKGLEAIGIENSLDELTPEQQRVLNTSRQDLGTAGTVGRVAGEVATFAAPGGAAAKLGTKALAAGARGARYAPAVADVATVAGMEALKSPTDERSRGEAALEGALGGALGRAVAGVGAVALRGLKPAEQAKKLLEYARANGIELRLTPGQIKGGIIEQIESMAERVPIAAQLIGRQKRTALEDWNRSVLTDVMPKVQKGMSNADVRITPKYGPNAVKDPIKTAGVEGVQETQNRFGSAYTELEKGMAPVSAAGSLDTAADIASELPAKFQTRFGKDAEYMVWRIEKAMSGDGGKEAFVKEVQQVDDLLRSRAKSADASGYKDLGDAYRKFRDDIRLQTELFGRGNWKALDRQYGRFAEVRDAALSAPAAKRGGVFTPAELLNQTDRFVGAPGGLRDVANTAGQVLGYSAPAPHALTQILLGLGGGTGGIAATVAGSGGTAAAIGAIPVVLSAVVYNPLTRKLLRPQPSKIVTALNKIGITGDSAKRLAGQIAVALNKARQNPEQEMRLVSELEALQQGQAQETEARNPYRVRSVEEVK